MPRPSNGEAGHSHRITLAAIGIGVRGLVASSADARDPVSALCAGPSPPPNLQHRRRHNAANSPVLLSKSIWNGPHHTMYSRRVSRARGAIAGSLHRMRPDAGPTAA